MTLKACMGKNARPSGVWTQLQAPGLQLFAFFKCALANSNEHACMYELQSIL